MNANYFRNNLGKFRVTRTYVLMLDLEARKARKDNAMFGRTHSEVCVQKDTLHSV